MKQKVYAFFRYGHVVSGSQSLSVNQSRRLLRKILASNGMTGDASYYPDEFTGYFNG